MPRTKTTWPKSTGAKPATRGPTGRHAQKHPPDYIPPIDRDFQPYVVRYLNGESLRMLATELECGYDTVRRRLIKWSLTGKADTAYADLVTEALVDRIARADLALADALTMCDITRADKICRYARTDYERRRPHLYGQRAEITFAGPAAIYLGIAEVVQSVLLPAPECMQIEQAEEQAEAET